MSTKNITRYLGSIFLLLSLTTTQNAYAEGFDLFKPSDDNWLIKHIFLQLFYPDVSPLGPISEVFLAGILAFGGILAGYTMLAGTLHTANDGEMLGKKWSSLWIPIRTTLGVSMILPIKGGFCAIQLVLIWIAVQGIGLADQTWNAFAENPLKGSVVPQPYIDKQVKELYKAGVMGYACLAAIQKDQDENEADAKSAGIIDKLLKPSRDAWNPGITTTTSKGANNSQRLTIEFGNKNNEVYRNVCGSITYDMSLSATQSVSSAPAAALDLVDLDKIQHALVPVHVTALSALLARSSQIGNKLVNSDEITPESLASDMNTATDAYKVAIALAANTAYQDAISKDAVEAMKKDGFVSAGAWFIRIASAQDAVNALANNVPMGTGPGSYLEESTGWWFDTSGKTNYPSVEKVIKKTKAYFGKANMINNNSASGAGVGADGEINLLDKLLAYISPSELGALFDSQSMTSNPVIAIVSIGSKLINFVIVTASAIVAGIVVVGTTSLVASGGVIAGVTFATPLLASLLGTLLWNGVKMAYVLVWKPFIIWCGAVIGWLILVVESLFAGPLWMVAHLAPDQDGVVGKMGQGYMLVLSLFLRPVLMVIGFVAALSLMTPCLMFINAFIAFNGNAIGVGAAALIGKIVMISIYLKVVEEVMNKLFGLIHSIPDSILQWIGGGLSRSMGDYANGIEAGSTQNTERFGQGMSQVNQAVTNAGTDKIKRVGAERKESLKGNMTNVSAGDEPGSGAGNKTKASESPGNKPKTKG